MSAPEDTATPAAPSPGRGRRLRAAAIAVAAGVALLLALVFVGTRYVPLIPQARVFIEARTDGLKVGRFGRLKIEGLSGDVWRDFRIRRLTIRDEKGVWLEARNIHMSWRYGELLRRRFHAEKIDAELVRVIRRPTLTPKSKDRGLPVSFFIDEATAKVEMLPAFSYERGLYDLELNLNVQRRGGQAGRLQATSLLHAGDHLNLVFDISKTRPLVLRANALEAQGGALAGALGLSPDQPFTLAVDAGGRMSQGRVQAIARTGAVEPLRAQGAWNPQGGEVSGLLRLDVSRLTESYARRFGPTATFELFGRRVADGLFDLRLRADAENLGLSAVGRGNVGERRLGPEGLALVATTRELSRILGGPRLGASRVEGRLTGVPSAWRIVGTGAVSGFEFAGFTLARAAGPLQAVYEKGVLSLSGKVTSSGGGGQGWIAAVMGGRPNGMFQIDRLKDGRLLIRRAQVFGAGLNLDATGDRTLFGALTFKGKAQISNLRRALIEANGGAVATWTASQTAADRPWNFTLGAKGQNFATGLAELDKMLGVRPDLRLDASLANNRWAIRNMRLDGVRLNATGNGSVVGEAIAIKLDWTATGPFRAGPAELNGRFRGQGAVGGTFTAPRLDLDANVAEIDVPGAPLRDARVLISFLRQRNGTSGAVAVTATSAYGPAQGRSDFLFPPNGLDLTNLAFEVAGVKATGALSLRRDIPSSADLLVEVTRGAFLDGGRLGGRVRIVDAQGGPRATLNLSGENARLRGATVIASQLRLAADGPVARLPYSIHALGGSAAGPWMADGRGVIVPESPGYLVTFDGRGRLGDRTLNTTETARVRFGGQERSAHVRLAASDGGRVNLDARLTHALADVRADVAGLDLRLVNEDLAGRTDAVVVLQGRGGRLDGVITAKLIGARGRGSPAASGVNGVVEARLNDSVMSVNANAGGQGMRANASLVLPAEASAAPFRVAINRRRPIQGRFSAQGEVRALWDLLIGGDRSLSGQVQTEGTLAGTLADPKALGQITVANGRFDDGVTGLTLRQAALRASFDDDQINVSDARAVDGQGGQVIGSGRISLERNGVSSFRMILRGFRLIDNEQATASASGEATIARAANGRVRLSGDLAIDRADVAARLPTPSGVVPMDVVEKNRPAELIATLPVQRRRGVGWDLDVNLSAPRRVFLRGQGLDMELSLDAHVGGTTSDPDLSGTARIVRGDYQFAGRRFEFDQDSVVYLSSRPAGVRLDLTATREDPSLTAVVRIRGTAARPEITFTSNPSLPNDEVLSQVLFGRSASQLSPLEAAQLASALSSFSRGGGFDVIGNLRTFAGLDRLALGGGDERGVTVSGGKYLTDDVYLELTGGGREGSSAQVEWRVRRNLSVLSRIGGQGGSRLAVRWRRDY